MHACRAVLHALLIQDFLRKDEVCVFRRTYIGISVAYVDYPVIFQSVLSQNALLAGTALLTFIVHPGKLY